MTFKAHTHPSLREKFGLTHKQLTILINTLNQLIQEGPLNSITGICDNWKRYTRQQDEDCAYFVYDLVSSLAADWPFTRMPGINTTFPVDDDYKFKLWEGPNLEARRSLMRYITKRLRDWRRRTPCKQRK